MNDLTRYRVCAGMNAPPNAKLIYFYLLDMAGHGKKIAISAKRLAKGIGISTSATRKNLHRLKRLDMLTITPCYTEDGGRLANQYMLI